MKLKSTLAVAVLLALLIAPQAVAGPGTALAKRAAKAACEAERAELGRDAFREEYGRGAMRACMLAHMDEAAEAVKNAAQECRAEREGDLEGFRDDYGVNHNKRNAFGTCVARKVHEAMAGGEDEGEAPAPPAP
jgi:hypothetical protein